MANFRPKKWVFGHQNEICRQNTTRDLFLYHQMGAACKIWANSIGSFPRSGVDWKKRLKLIFEKGLGLGALPRPRKLKRTVWANHLDGMTVWHWVVGDNFDERRAAPPAYGRRAWSKVVSHIGFFINFPKLIRVQALPEYQNGFN